MSRGQPQTRSLSARRTLERCQNRRNSDEAIIIDDDTENADVVLIDNPNTYQGSKNAETTRLSYAPGGVIYIDDEEEDPRNSSTGTTISNQFAETFCSLSLSENSDGDSSFMFVRSGNVCCDHTGPSTNCYAFDLDSENSITQSASPKSNTDECDEFDCSSSDCEIIEDHSGIIREQWERAASRKNESCQFASTDQATAPDSIFDAEDPSHGPILHDADVANYFERMPSNYFEEILAESSNSVELDPSAKIDSTYKNEDFHFKTTDNISLAQSCSSSHIPFKKPGYWREDDDSNLEEYPQTAHSMDDGLSFLNNDAPLPTKYSFFPCKNFGETKFFNKEELSSRKSYAYFKWDGKQVSENNDLCSDKVEHKLDEDSFGAEAKHDMVFERESSDFKENKKRDFEESLPFCSQQQEDQPIKTRSSTFYSDMDHKMTNKEDEIFAATDIRSTSHKLDDMPHGIESLIGDREKHKKTDEYKRAVEEEWASRQQQLLIQAEEAQRLRKRRKAENMRLLDMEKRQKQRLEEIRDLQKKDEETIQLKEQIRTEVRKDLEMLEMNCRDMVSVLRALGIHVKGGFIPGVHEINAAYKQALLRFHPDRASRTDIREQVIAEEKFKLISRLKEKLSPI